VWNRTSAKIRWPQTCLDSSQKVERTQGNLVQIMLAQLKADIFYADSWSRITDFWCQLMHPSPMWPIHGHYQCPKCKRIYRVPWHNN